MPTTWLGCRTTENTCWKNNFKAHAFDELLGVGTFLRCHLAISSCFCGVCFCCIEKWVVADGKGLDSPSLKFTLGIPLRLAANLTGYSLCRQPGTISHCFKTWSQPWVFVDLGWISGPHVESVPSTLYTNRCFCHGCYQASYCSDFRFEL